MSALRRILSALLLSLAALRGQAAALPSGLPSQPSAPLTDQAEMISAGEAQRLNSLLNRVWDGGRGPQIAVVTLPSLGGDSIEAVSLAIARGWALGDKERQDGVLLLIAQSDRKLRIEVGTHFEGALTDVACHRIIDDVMVPRLRAGDPDAAVEAGVAHILSFVAPGQAPEAPEEAAADNGHLPLRFWLWVILLILWVVLPVLFRWMGFIGYSGRGGFGGGWGGGSSWGGGGGFSGGGGGFSGGGSSGSW